MPGDLGGVSLGLGRVLGIRTMKVSQRLSTMGPSRWVIISRLSLSWMLLLETVAIWRSTIMNLLWKVPNGGRWKLTIDRSIFGISSGGGTVFSWLSALSAVAGLFAWGTCCYAYLRFRKAYSLQGYDLALMMAPPR